MKSCSTDVLLGKVADALLRVRLNQNLTQQTVADRSGISLKAVVNLESGNVADRFGIGMARRVLGEIRTALEMKESARDRD